MCLVGGFKTEPDYIKISGDSHWSTPFRQAF